VEQRRVLAAQALKLGFGHPIGAIGGLLKSLPVGNEGKTPAGPYEPLPNQNAEREGHPWAPYTEH
jgi:hypothetical protein